MLSRSPDMRKSHDLDHPSKAKLCLLSSQIEDKAFLENYKKDKTIDLNAPRTYAINSTNPETVYSLR